MDWKTAVVAVILAPMLALLGGAGILAWQIGETWTEATTASLVTGLVTVCGGGAVVMALILSLIVGIPMATRFFAEQGVARKAWGEGSAPQYWQATGPALPPPNGWQEPRPPALDARDDGGTWHVGRSASYDLWDEDGVGVDRRQWDDWG